jgi:hypothetical protein
MNEQTQNNHPLEDQPEGKVSSTPGDRLPEAPPARKFKLTWEFVAGFLGWYLVTGLIYAAGQGQETLIICGGLLFPVNVVLLILFLRRQPQLGWGMLSALGVNLVISLILGLSTSAFCFIPFFSGVK